MAHSRQYAAYTCDCGYATRYSSNIHRHQEKCTAWRVAKKVPEKKLSKDASKSKEIVSAKEEPQQSLELSFSLDSEFIDFTEMELEQLEELCKSCEMYSPEANDITSEEINELCQLCEEDEKTD